MKNSRKSKKVSWAPGVNLVQVRSFQTENCPSNDSETQNRPKAKASWTLHSNCMACNDLPPGFEGYHSGNQLKEKPAFIPRLKWKCSPKFVTRCEWQVAAGEESKEAEAQKLREKTVLEAVYPLLFSIPPNPFISLDIEDEHYDDSLTPLIPFASTEDEEFSQSNLAADVAASDLKTLTSIPINSQPPVNPTTGLQQPPGFSQFLPASETPNTSECNTRALEPPTSTKPATALLTGISADTIAAASAALTAIVKSNEPGSMIDTDLLVEILNNPKMIEKLANDIGAPTNTVSAPLSKLQPISQSLPLATPKPDMVSISRPTNGGDLGHDPDGVRHTLNSPLPRLDPAVVPTHRLPSENSHTVPNRLQTTSSIIKQSSPAVPLPRRDPVVFPTPRPPIENLYVEPNRLQPMFNYMQHQPAKDVNYYKNLIRQHGGEKEENKESHLLSQYIDHNNLLKGLPKSREVKRKNQKACMYFNSSKGCKNGTNCLYKHEISMQKRVGHMFEAQTSKRMRMGGEITRFGWI